MYATWHAGACIVPMNFKLHPREFGYIVEHSGTRLCFASSSLAPGLRAELGERFQVHECDAGWLERRRRDAPAPLVSRAAEALAWLFYTSGTTGRPKGASLSQRNLLFASQAYYADIDYLNQRDTIVHAAPLSHGSGLYAMPHFARGAHNVITASGHFSPQEMYSAIERFPNVSFFAAPTMLVRMLADVPAARALTNLKTIIYGGAPMYLADLERALDLFGPRLYQLYGQGEAPMTISGLDQAAHLAAAGEATILCSAGRARTGVEIAILDAEDRPLPPGEIGEIATHSDAVMLGYWNDPAASAAAIRNGWLRTGDVGSIDERGFLTLRDRSKDMIISGGSNIYPREVEEVLLRHAGVAQVSVIGLPHSEWGEEVVAVVVSAGAAPPPENELDALCLVNIARFKRPRRYIFVTDLPKNNYGKVLKTELRAALSGKSNAIPGGQTHA
jgi:long-chain acyl-CoA synthetase